jgi:MFS family permease
MREPRIRAVQSAWCACIVAEFALTTALAVYAYRAGGPIAVGVVGLVRAVPAGAVGPFAATIADRMPRERALVAILTVRVLSVAAAAAAALADAPIGLLYAAAAIDAVVYSVYWPAHSSLLVELADDADDLTSANAASTTIENVGGLAGPVIAGILLALASAGAVLAVSAGLLACGAALASRVTVDRGRAGLYREHPAADERIDLLAGFRTLRREPAPRLIIGLYLAQTLCLGAANALVVLLALDVLGVNDGGVGILLAVCGFGGIVGSLVSLGLVGRPRLGAWLRGALLAWGAGMMLVGASDDGVLLIVAAIGLAIIGAGNALVDVTALTLLQRLVRDDVLARVLGVFEGLWWVALGLGGLLAAAAAESHGTRPVIFVVGLVLPSLALVSSRALAALDRRHVDLGRPLELLRGMPLFAALPTLALERLAIHARPMSVKTGDVVIERGAVGDRFYVIDSGSLEAVHDEGVSAMGPGDGFGEIALLRDVPRTATVRATSDADLHALERVDFLAAMRSRPATVE